MATCIEVFSGRRAVELPNSTVYQSARANCPPHRALILCAPIDTRNISPGGSYVCLRMASLAISRAKVACRACPHRPCLTSAGEMTNDRPHQLPNEGLIPMIASTASEDRSVNLVVLPVPPIPSQARTESRLQRDCKRSLTSTHKSLQDAGGPIKSIPLKRLAFLRGRL